MWIKFTKKKKKKHWGLEIRGGFLAKHIFSFAERKALEKSRVCQTWRAAARFTEPSQISRGLWQGLLAKNWIPQEALPTSPGLLVQDWGRLTLPWSQHLVVSKWPHEMQPLLPARSPIPLLNEAHHHSPSSYHPKSSRGEGKICEPKALGPRPSTSVLQFLSPAHTSCCTAQAPWPRPTAQTSRCSVLYTPFWPVSELGFL